MQPLIYRTIKEKIVKKGTDYEMASKKSKGSACTFPQNTPIAQKRKANNRKANAAVGG